MRTTVKNKLYNNALYGIESYSRKELKNFSQKKIEKIKEIHIKADKVLTSYINEKSTTLTRVALQGFKTNQATIALLFTPTEHSLKSGINPRKFFNKKEIEIILVSEGVLPENYHSL